MLYRVQSNLVVIQLQIQWILVISNLEIIAADTSSRIVERFQVLWVIIIVCDYEAMPMVFRET